MEPAYYNKNVNILSSSTLRLDQLSPTPTTSSSPMDTPKILLGPTQGLPPFINLHSLRAQLSSITSTLTTSAGPALVVGKMRL